MMSERLQDFFREDGRTVILPMDHGTAIPVPELARMGDLLASVRESVDGYVVNLGVARAFREELSGAGVCLRADVYKPDLAEGSVRAFGPDEAGQAGATAFMHMLYPGHANEAEILLNCAELISETLEEDLPVLVEALPKGLGLPEEYTPEAVGFAVRQAAELGAAVVKTAYPTGGTVDDFRAIVESCFVPVIVLGGAPMGDDAALYTLVRQAMDAGAAGVAIGRNVWQHENPARMARRLAAIVHEDATVDEARKLD